MNTEQQLRDEILTDADWPHGMPWTLIGNALVLLARALDNQDALVREELASMGGDLVSTHGAIPVRERDSNERALASLGGYLLERFGRK